MSFMSVIPLLWYNIIIVLCCEDFFSVSFDCSINFNALITVTVCRPVSDADIQNLEKRLMQTMDMIVMKKKR